MHFSVASLPTGQQVLQLDDADVHQIEAAFPPPIIQPLVQPAPVQLPVSPPPSAVPSTIPSPPPVSQGSSTPVPPSSPVSVPQPPIPPATPSPQPPIAGSETSTLSRQKFLKWVGLGGGGLVLALVINEVVQRQQSPSPVNRQAIALRPFPFGLWVAKLR